MKHIRTKKFFFTIIHHSPLQFNSFGFTEDQKIKKPPKLDYNPSEASYTHLLKTPFYNFLQMGPLREIQRNNIYDFLFIGIKLVMIFVFVEGP